MRNNDPTWRLTRYFELYEQQMYRIAFGILHDENQAEDAVMAAFEGIVRNKDIPRNPASKKAEKLVFAAVRNAAIDQYRRNARERVRFQTLDSNVLEFKACHTDEPERAILAKAEFNEILEPLDISQQEVLRERFENGSSVREAATKLGISEASVRKRQQRAIADIRNMKGLSNEATA